MRQLNLPRKLVATVQMWVSLALILLTFLFSLMPIITIETSDLQGEIVDMIDDIGIKVNQNVKNQLKEDEINVSAFKLVGSITLIAKVVKAASASASSESLNNTAVKDLEKYVETEKGAESLVTSISLALAIVNIASDSAGNDMNKLMENPVSLILAILIPIIGLFAVLGITLILPVIFFFKALAASSRALKNIHTPEEATGKLAAALPAMVGLPLTFMLFQCVVPGMTSAPAISMITILCILSIVVNVLASRTREYPAAQFKYLNIHQGGALLGIIGFIVYFFSIIKSGVFNGFVNGRFSTEIIKAITRNNENDIKSLLIKGLFILIYLALVLRSTKYLGKLANRLSGSAKSKESNVVHAVINLLIYILPVVVVGTEYLGKYESGKLTGALIGIILMLASEIAALVLKKQFCADLSDAERKAFLAGDTMTSAEQLAWAENIVAANAAPAAVEEAPAAVEEAPAAEENTEA